MKRIDKAGQILNIVLSILYVPLSLFSRLLFMASEATIGAENMFVVK